MLGLTQITHSIFNPIRSLPIQTRYSDSVKESYFSLAGERKEDFVGRWGGEWSSVCSLAGRHFSFAQFLILSLFFPISRCGARLLLVTSLLDIFFDVAIHIRGCHWHWISGFFFSGAQSRRVCATAAKLTHLKLGQLFVLPRREAFWHMQYFTCLYLHTIQSEVP